MIKEYIKKFEQRKVLADQNSQQEREVRAAKAQEIIEDLTIIGASSKEGFVYAIGSKLNRNDGLRVWVKFTPEWSYAATWVGYTLTGLGILRVKVDLTTPDAFDYLARAIAERAVGDIKDTGSNYPDKTLP
jgi:hypothetical protein